MSLSSTVDVVPAVDIASLHAAALLLPSVKSERLFASAYATNWTTILEIFRKKYPQKTFTENPKEMETYQIFDTESSLKALKELGQEGWTPLEEALDQNVKAFA